MGRSARPGRPAPDPPLCAARRVARAAARLGGAPAADPGGRRPREGRPLREGLRVRRSRTADPRLGSSGRRRGGADPGDGSGRDRPAGRSRRDPRGARGAPRALARRRAPRRRALGRLARPSLAEDPRRGDGGRATRYARADRRRARTMALSAPGAVGRLVVVFCVGGHARRARVALSRGVRAGERAPPERTPRLDIPRSGARGRQLGASDAGDRDRSAGAYPARRDTFTVAVGAQSEGLDRARRPRLARELHAVLPPAAPDRRRRTVDPVLRVRSERVSGCADRLGGLRGTGCRS